MTYLRLRPVFSTSSIAVFYFASVAFRLDVIQYDLDEGTYLIHALRILQGAVPYKDFFVHQTPFFEYLLAFFATVFEPNLFYMRLPSLLSLSAGGLAIFYLVFRSTSLKSAVAAQILFYFSSVQYPVLLAMPNATALGCCIIGIALAFNNDSKSKNVLAACLFVIGLAVKPTVLTIIASYFFVTLLSQEHRKSTIVLGFVTGFLGILAIASIVVFSDGAFLDVLVMQLARHSQYNSIDLISENSLLGPIRQAQGLYTSLDWNLSTLKNVFIGRLEFSPSNFLPCSSAFLQTFLGLSGALILIPRIFRNNESVFLRFVFFSTLIEVVAAIWLWQPFWQHYAIQMTFGMSCMGGIVLGKMIPTALKELRPAATLGFVLFLAAYAQNGITKLQETRAFYDRAKDLVNEADQIFTFNPIISLVSGIPMTCGVVNAANVFDRTGSRFLGNSPQLAKRFVVNKDEVFECLRDNPDVEILIDFSFYFFLDHQVEFIHKILSLPKNRFVFYTKGDKFVWDNDLRYLNVLRRGGVSPIQFEHKTYNWSGQQ